MRVDIKMVGDLYTAMVKSPNGETRWTTPEPMDRPSLLEALDELGCDNREVIHALGNADPRVARDSRQALIDSLSDQYGYERAMKLLKEVEEDLAKEYRAAVRRDRDWN